MLPRSVATPGTSSRARANSIVLLSIPEFVFFGAITDNNIRHHGIGQRAFGHDSVEVYRGEITPGLQSIAWLLQHHKYRGTVPRYSLSQAQRLLVESMRYILLFPTSRLMVAYVEVMPSTIAAEHPHSLRSHTATRTPMLFLGRLYSSEAQRRSNSMWQSPRRRRRPWWLNIFLGYHRSGIRTSF